MQTKILIIGACGQIGTELTSKLRATYGVENVIASDIRKLENDVVNNGIFEVINALDYNQIEQLIEKYHLYFFQFHLIHYHQFLGVLLN